MRLTLPPAKTFADMLVELRTRVKLHATIGNTPALESILTEANDYVFDQLDNGMPWRSTLTLTASTALYPFVSDDGVPIARGSVDSVWVEQGGSDRVPLPQGISHGMRADTQLRSIPERYDTTMTDGEFTLEVWPTPNDAYALHIDHNRILTRFSQPTDKPCAPYRLVLSYAIATAKAHLGQADADLAGKAFQRLLTSEKEKQRENRRFIPPAPRPSHARPQIVIAAAGGAAASPTPPAPPAPSPSPPAPAPGPQAPASLMPSGSLALLTAQSVTFSTTNGNAITVSDADSSSLVVTLYATAGTLTAQPFSGAVIANNGTGTVTIAGSSIAINGALNGLVYTAPGTAQGVTITLTASDGALSGADSMVVNISAPPAPPPPPPPPPAPATPPAITTAAHPDELLLVGDSDDGYFIEDNRWGRGGLTEGSGTNQFMQETGRSLVTGIDGEVAFRTKWRWPQVANSEVKGYPAIISGRKPGNYGPAHKPAWEKNIILADGSVSMAAPSGPTPGTFLPQTVSALTSLKSKLRAAHNMAATGQGQLTFDIWLQSHSPQDFGFTASSITHEIMIPLGCWGSYGAHPSNRNPNWYDHDAVIGGRAFHVYCTKNSGRNDVSGVWDGGSYQGLRYNFGDLNGSYTNNETGSPRIGWKMIAFVPAGNAWTPESDGSFDIDLKALIQYVATRVDSRGVPWATGNEYVSSVELGVEPVHGEGDITVYDYRVWRP